MKCELVVQRAANDSFRSASTQDSTDGYPSHGRQRYHLLSAEINNDLPRTRSRAGLTLMVLMRRLISRH